MRSKKVNNFSKFLLTCLFMTIIIYSILDMIFYSFNCCKIEHSERNQAADIVKAESLTCSYKEILIPEEYQNMQLSCKTYMCFRKITDKTSNQYRLINDSGEITVDNEGYLVTDDGFIGVAMGSYFGSVGNKFIVELDTGKTIKVIKVEEKADVDTCELNFMGSTNNDVIEFVIDTENLSMINNIDADNGYIYMGNFNNYERFNGNIVSIKQVI